MQSNRGNSVSEVLLLKREVGKPDVPGNYISVYELKPISLWFICQKHTRSQVRELVRKPEVNSF